MDIPLWFASALQAEFQDRLRIRWSVQRSAFHIEQRVGRPTAVPREQDEHDDRTVRARAGFDLFCEVARGDRLPCPECGQLLKLTPFAFVEATCARCRDRQREGRWGVGFFPLNDSLLQYLRRCDTTLIDHRVLLRNLDEENARLEETREGDYTYQRQDILKEGIIHEQIPKVGWTTHTVFEEHP